MKGCKKFLIYAIAGVALATLFRTAAVQAEALHPSEKKLRAILSQFEQYAEKTRREWRIPGMAIAIVRDGKVIYANGFGVKKLGDPDPVDSHTVFQIGSITKGFTAALLAMMVDEKKLNWKDRVIDHLPDFQMCDPWVTREFLIEDLMAQRSGLVEQAASALPLVGFDAEHVVCSLRYIEPISSFRSEYAYQNSLFLVAALLVERYTGKSWATNIRERIFKPLGMKESSTDAKGLVNSNNSAYLHRHEGDRPDGAIVPIEPDWPYFDWVYKMGPAGGINSNVMDMAQWLIMQLNDGSFNGKQIISEESIDFMRAPKTIMSVPARGEQLYYCQAWVFNTYQPYPIVWHNGGTFGAHSIISMMPEAKLGIAVLTNLKDAEAPEALHKRFYDLYFGSPYRDWSRELLEHAAKEADEEKPPQRPTTPSPHMPADYYIGDYFNSVYGAVTVRERDGILYVTVGPKKVRMPLNPWNADVFSTAIPDLMDWGGFVRFQGGPEGKAESMTIDLFNQGGAGVFNRMAPRQKRR